MDRARCNAHCQLDDCGASELGQAHGTDGEQTSTAVVEAVQPDFYCWRMRLQRMDNLVCA